MKKNIVLLAVAATALTSGCATITRGTTQPFKIETDPAGASAKLSTGETCETPCTLTKKRKEAFTVTVAKPGYKTETLSVTNKMSGAGGAGLAGNILVGGLIGVGVDASSGATLDLTPNPLIVKMQPEDVPAVVAAAPEAPAAEVASAAPAVTAAPAAEPAPAAPVAPK